MFDFGGIVTGVLGGLDKLFTSDDERNKAKITLERLKQQPMLMQALITQQEAKHKSIFVAGWRPAIGWVCAIALFYGFVINPILSLFFHRLPHIDIPEIIGLVGAMLGMAGWRSFDKAKGTTFTIGQTILPPPEDTNNEKR